jgi:epoxyqueuosine reductase QueG
MNSRVDKKEIINMIKEYTKTPENSMQKWGNEPAWADPLVGFSNGADPLYKFYKQDIGDFYGLPVDFLENKHPDKIFEPEKISIISWILPQTTKTKQDHRKETHFPSERWARSRIYGEEFNVKLRKHMERGLENLGIEAVAPMNSSIWRTEKSEKYAFASTWSERHAAYAAGLGTFGLSDGLITPVGKAMRTGSIIANIYLEPDEKPYEDHNAYCLFYQKGSCLKCVERCPIGAISEKGHDKYTCQKYVSMTREYVPNHYGFDGYGCGFCQTGVPCESMIPPELTK